MVPTVSPKIREEKLRAQLNLLLQLDYVIICPNATM